MTRDQLLKFAGSRTPAHALWIEIKPILLARDPRGAKKYVFAWGFALGVQWALTQMERQQADLTALVTRKEEAILEEVARKARLEVLR